MGKSNAADEATKAVETTTETVVVENAPFIAKIVEAPAEEVAKEAEPVKVPRGKTGLIYTGIADVVELGEGKVVRRGDTVIAAGDEVERLLALGFTEVAEAVTETEG